MIDNLNKTSTDDITQCPDYRRFIYIGSLIGSLFLMVFFIINLTVFNLYYDSIIDGIGALILFLIHRAEGKSPVKPLVVLLGVIVVTISISIGVFSNNATDGVTIWLSILPFICFLFLGKRLGIIASLAISLFFLMTLSYCLIMHPDKGFNLIGLTSTAGALLCSTVIAWAYTDNRSKMINLLTQQATTDALTLLLNRRGLMTSFNLFIALYKRKKQNLCVMILDLDNFKLVNDNFGHDIGDNVIISCANTLKTQLRETDTIARLGGEEFIMLLSHTTIEEAESLAYRIKDTIEKSIFSHINHSDFQVTASIGITCATEHKTSFESLYKAADEALYEAKKNGRNCIYLN